MNNKALIAVLFVTSIGLSFWGGGKFAASKTTAQNSRGQFSTAGGQFARGGGTGGTRGAGGGFVGGEILSQDSGSITVKLPNNQGTKIILIASSTQILKSTTGTLSDLKTGTSVTAQGQANSDGSVTAQSIQIRPAGMGM